MIISLDKFKATGGTKVEGNLDITENGVYDVSGFATITINTDASQGVNYSYLTGGVDVEGLRAIGWDDESIGYFRDNFNIYSWQAPYYMVTEENKALYGVVNSDTDMYTVEGMKYCPMIDTSNKSVGSLFGGCSLLTSIPKLDTSKVTDMSRMFDSCSLLTSIPQLDTSKVTDMQFMFNRCSSLSSIPQLNTSNVTNMYCMFQDCFSLTSIPQLDTSNVTIMSNMFKRCSLLTSIPLLDTNNVTDMNDMFNGCSSLTSIPQLNTSNVTGMNNMFQNCSSLTSIPQLNTSNVTNILHMFEGCSSLTSIPQLDTSNVTNMEMIFKGCSSLTSIPLLDTNNVTGMNGMFNGCSSLTSIPQLNTSNVTRMDDMFNGCSSLTSIPQLNTSNVTNMNNIFYGCSKLERVEGIDFSSYSNSSYPKYIFGFSAINSLTHFIVNGVINFSLTSYGLDYAPNLDFDSIKSILVAMSKTTNTNAKTMKFNHTLNDKGTELRDLLSLCTSKGWTTTNLLINNDPNSETGIALPISVIDANTNENVGEFTQTVTSVPNVYSYPFENVTGDFYFVDAQGNYYANPVSKADNIYGKGSATANVSNAASYYLNKSQQVIHIDTVGRYVVHICLDDETIRWNGNTTSIPTGTPTN